MKRVLVWGLSNNRAGTEAVIYNYASHIPDVAFDFLCYGEPLSYSSLFEGGTNRYFVIPVKIDHPVAYTRELNKFMREHGHEYDVLWAHLNDISNIDILEKAAKCGIERRIVHAHNSSIPDYWITKLFTALNKKKFRRLPTDRWACSKAAGDFFYGSEPYKVLPNMVDAEKVSFSEEKRKALREIYRIEQQFVIGTTGRLVPQKNPMFLIELLPSILENRPNAVLMFVGEGILEPDMRRRAKELGLDDRVRFCGVQSDIQAFLSAFDVFAFPSLYEGLPVSLLEAQFNGLPCVISEGISDEAVISKKTKRLSIERPEVWIEPLIECGREDDFLIVDKSNRYDIRNGAAIFRGLLEI